MNVEILAYPIEWQRIIWTAARTCYSEVFPTRIWQDFPSQEEFNKMFDHLYKSGHWSVFEHINFTVAVEQVTRQTTHQLVRHRHFSFSQQSMRYVQFGDNVEIDLPEGEWYWDIGIQAKYLSLDAYQQGIEKYDLPAEDVRRILPIGTKTNIVFTANLRALMDFSSVRRCVLAQKEINALADELRRKIHKIDSRLGNTLMIKCQRSGVCDEERNVDNKVCNIRPHIDQTNLQRLEVIR